MEIIKNRFVRYFSIAFYKNNGSIVLFNILFVILENPSSFSFIVVR